MIPIERMKDYYKSGFWSLTRIEKLLENNKITKEDYQEILEKIENKETNTIKRRRRNI